MAIGRRTVLAGGAALWLAPAIVGRRAQPKVHVEPRLRHARRAQVSRRRRRPPDYVNPDAPKGGTVRFGTQGTFDSLHPFILKGVPAAGIGRCGRRCAGIRPTRPSPSTA